MGWAKYNEDIMDAIYERTPLVYTRGIPKPYKPKKVRDYSWVGMPFRTKIGDVDYDFENNEVRVVFKVTIDAVLLKKLTSFGWKHNRQYDYWLKPIKKKNIEYARDVLVA